MKTGPVFLPCQCFFCAKSEPHPPSHVESTKINGVIACNRCAHVTPMPKLKPKMPFPDCEIGFPEDQLRGHFTPIQWEAFTKWAVGINPWKCGEHGLVYEAKDLYDWLYVFGPVE